MCINNLSGILSIDYKSLSKWTWGCWGKNRVTEWEKLEWLGLYNKGYAECRLKTGNPDGGAAWGNLMCLVDQVWIEDKWNSSLNKVWYV